MSKIIVKNLAGLDDATVLRLTLSVVNQGEISGSGPYKQYCYCTTFTVEEEKYAVWVFLHRKSGTQTFTITKESKQA